ncbi:MAG: hypothetical protein GY694_13640 [Gammaproteobacteria bacterium]|nr:hypothetical protein [Gammaproteobacteria bacterium]
MFLNTVNKTLSFIWHFHRKLIVSFIILLAVVLSGLSALSVYLEKNPEVVQHLIETNLGVKISFDALDTHINSLYPSISMTDFAIQDELNEESLLEFSSARVALNIPLTIISGHIVVHTLELKGFNALVYRDANNQISIADFHLSNTVKTQTDSRKKIQNYFSLINRTHFSISESEIYFVDEMKELPEVLVSGINLKMKNNGKRHQVSLKARLNDSATFIDLQLDFNGDINNVSNWDGQVYAAVDNLNQQALLHFLQKDFLQIEEFKINNIEASAKIWSKIIKGKLQSIQGGLLSKNAHLVREDDNREINFDSFDTQFKLTRSHSPKNKKSLETQNIDWILDLYDLNLSVDSEVISKKFINVKLKREGDKAYSYFQVFLNQINVGEFSNVISFFSPQMFNQDIYSYLKPKGLLENIFFTFQVDASEMPIDVHSYQVQLDINQFGMNSIQSIPKIRNFSAQVLFNETMGRALVDSHDMKLYLKSLFRDSWLFDHLKGEIFWQKEGDEWFSGTDNLLISSSHFTSLQSNVHFWLSGEKPAFMNLTAFYENVDVQAISNYIPAKVMDVGLVEWLDYSLISGLVPDGGIAFRGNLSDFPYQKHNGNMDIVFNTENVLLEYLQSWPKLSHINSQVQFTQKGMRVDGRYSKLFSAQSKNVEVVLNDYFERILLITGDIRGNLQDGLNFLEQSKLVSTDVLNIIDAKGDIDISLDLKLPLKKASGKTSGEPLTKTKITLKNVEYYPPGFEKQKGLVSQVKGDIFLKNTSVSSNNLTAKIMELPAKISIKTDKNSIRPNFDPNISLNIDSQFSPEKLNQYKLIPEPIKPLADFVSGSSNLRLNVDLPNNQREFSFNIKSSLKGLDSKLPFPFTKTDKQSSPIEISYSKRMKKKREAEASRIKFMYSDLLSLDILLGASLRKAAQEDEFELLKGSIAFEDSKAVLPKERHLSITGALKQFPFAQWQTLLTSSNIRSSKSESPLKPLSIPIEINMSEIVFPELKFEGAIEEKVASSAVKKSQERGGPENFPLLNGQIDSVKLGNADLGLFTIQSSRVDKAVIFDELVVDGSLFSFKGNGKWHHWNATPEVDLGGSMEIPSVEKLLIALGYDQLIRQGKAKISGYLSWQGDLSDLGYETIDGKLIVDAEKGAWIEGKPGAAGRLLGLLNMNAFSRRLSLDFSDVSKDGFEFDKIEGSIRLQDAMASTDNMKIYSPSAKILVRGSTGLVTEKIDQRVTVIPEVSATLPLAGAAVAGPAGAAVVWVGQKILGDQLNQVTAYDYTIKGNWSEPVIKKDKTSGNTLKNLKTLFKHNDENKSPSDASKIFDIQ